MNHPLVPLVPVVASASAGIDTAVAGMAPSGTAAVTPAAAGAVAVATVMPPAATPARQRALGVLLFLAALCCFASYDAFAKHMVGLYAPTVVNLGRYTAVGCVALVLLLRHGQWAVWRQPQQGLLVLRGGVLAITATCFMTALVTMPLAEATAIYFTAPLLMVALSPWLLGEQVARAQWLAVAIGFAGMLLIVRPGGTLPLAGSLLMAVAALCYALFQVLTRKLAGQVPAPVQYAYMAALCLVVTNLPALWAAPVVWPTPGQMAVLVAGGLVSAGAQLLLLAAFRRVALATLAPLNYIQLLLAVLISTFWFKRPPDGLALLGMGCIVAGGLVLARTAPRR